MKSILIIGVIAVVAYFGYQKFSEQGGFSSLQGPQGEPVYARMTATQAIGSREVEAVVIVRTHSQEDCEQRGRRAASSLLVNCKDCEQTQIQCLGSLGTRESGYLEKRPTHLTYLVGEPGARDEREGAMIFWGLTVDEARQLCDYARQELSKRYAGTLTCIRERDA